MKVGIMGGDAYINSVLRPYVEHFSAKTPDWQTFIKFFLILLGEYCLFIAPHPHTYTHTLALLLPYIER